MRLKVTAPFALAALLAAAPSMGYQTKPQIEGIEPGPVMSALLACDNGVENSAYFQQEQNRYGNEFDLGGTGARISSISFKHHGFQTLSGPYTYDIEIWDRATCTLVGQTGDLSAADAFGTIETEEEDLCPNNFRNVGLTLVMIHAKSCADPPTNGDCYPDVIFDDNSASQCPWIVFAGSPQTCSSASAFGNGAFLLRIETDNCPTPVTPGSWGAVKTLYR